ncbi:MAG: signal peptide peptidase SppA [Treponema sp.]|nr:signal peptide peptidase SppA [Treponema sp.]
MTKSISIFIFALLLPVFAFFSCTNQSSVRGAYLEINLNESQGNTFFSLARQPLEIFAVIEKAASDDRIRGIILNIGSFAGSSDYLWELRSALVQFKAAGKKIIAFISYADMDTYLLASAADQIVMDELGTLTMMGYSMGRGYVKNTLEKFGIGVRELRYFEYKSAGEMYTRDSLSAADRKQYSDYLDDIFTLSKNTIINARNWTDEIFNGIINNEFLFSAKSAIAGNLVDHTGRADAVFEAVNEIEGEEINNFFLYGDSNTSLTGAIRRYSVSNAGFGASAIAVVYADGQTDMEMGMSASSLSRIICSLADNRRFAAIVLRINSPGGSAEAADYIDEAVRYAKQKKPVVVSMGEVAASGGYWAAMSASHIVSNPYTITGSIGVIGSWLYDNGLTAKLGLSTDVIMRGEHSDLYTGFLFPYRDLTRAEEERYKQNILDIYSIFTQKVAAGRRMDIEKVEEAAQGRIFSGIRALEAGLIDSLGGIYDAVRIARSLADIPEDRKTVYKKFPEPTFMEQLMGNLSISAGSGNKIKTEYSLIDLFLPDTDIRYRLMKNGHVMPILPLEF